MKEYNTTQLHPDTCLERHVFHRDQFAHVFRWSHVLKRAKIGMNILDFGCGTGNLAELLYRNKYKASMYLGLDIRKQTVENNREKFKDVPWVRFEQKDLCEFPYVHFPTPEWDMICSFEVCEHVQKKNVVRLLQNMVECCSDHTVVLISTPVFDPETGAAQNHIINGEVCEMGFEEFKGFILEAGFEIQGVYGTFASQKDYKHLLDKYPGLPEIYEKLHGYYDSNILACLIAPLFPEQSRNCLWELRKRK